MYEKSAIGIFRSAPDGGYVHANPAGVRLHGYDSESELLEAVGNVGGEVYVNPQDRLEMRRLLQEQGFVERFECPIYRHKTREVIWVRQNVYRVTDDEGRFLYLEGFVEDISDRKRIEEDLRRARARLDNTVSEQTEQLRSANRVLTEEIENRISAEKAARRSQEDLRNVVDQAGDGFFIVNIEDGRFIDVNNQACVSLGYRRDELLEMAVSDIDADFPGDAFKTLVASLKPGESTTISGRHRRKEGSLFPVEIRIGLIDLQGQTRLLALARDVTDKQLAEQALRQSEEDFRQLAEGSIQGVLIAGLEGKPLFSNDECARIFGYASKDEILALPSTLALIAPYEVARLEAIRRPFLQEPRAPIRYEFDGVKKEGDIVSLECVAGTVNWRGRVAAYLTLYDVTERKKSEERFRQAQKMETVGQLTGGIAHDFNNLLSVIMGNAELLTDSLGEDDRALQAILGAAERGADLTQRLLAFSRQQPLRPQAVDLGALTASLSQLLARTLGEAIQITTESAPDLWRARADPGQVENAVLNLALNARDAMAGRGMLTIACANSHLDEAAVTGNPDTQAGDYVTLSVSDDGVGMPSEVLAQVFEPFFTTKEVGQGSGLGLSMVYGFVKQSGGFVTIESEERRGTRVTLHLPRAKEAAADLGEASQDPLPQGRGEVILVVEDNPDVRQLVAAMLEGLGYGVVAVADAAAARQALAGPWSADLILSDVVLPGGTSGPELVEQVRQRSPDMKVVFMSGFPAESAKNRAFLAGDTLLLTKPFKKQALAEMLRVALA
ncbi:MAG: PAS domain-containing hybrid sensor histidine kinase/response regulator [Rhodospirillales bacterium]